jgi:hypothetical protein
MPLPTVVMQPPAGTSPSKVHHLDGSVSIPNAAGQISVPSNLVSTLIDAGWSIVILANQTHVP